MKKVTYTCEMCGTDEIVWDAWAEWDAEEQKEILNNSFDYCYCLKCEEETNAVEVEYEETRETPQEVSAGCSLST